MDISPINGPLSLIPETGSRVVRGFFCRSVFWSDLRWTLHGCCATLTLEKAWEMFFATTQVSRFLCWTTLSVSFATTRFPRAKVWSSGSSKLMVSTLKGYFSACREIYMASGQSAVRAWWNPTKHFPMGVRANLVDFWINLLRLHIFVLDQAQVPSMKKKKEKMKNANGEPNEINSMRVPPYVMVGCVHKEHTVTKRKIILKCVKFLVVALGSYQSLLGGEGII